MPRHIVNIIILLGLSLALAVPALAAGGNGNPAGMASWVATLPGGDLDSAEEADLIHMRQEEKLARDVYLTLHDSWALPAFVNIAAAEQTHMDTVLALLQKYGLADPAADDTRGVFSDPAMTALYGQLCQQGAASLVDALQAGATIEDLDLSDLEQALGRADNNDILTAWQNLAKGSRNHLRSFAGLLAAQGVTYQAQYLSQDQVDAILASPPEQGALDADGQPTGGWGGGGGGPWWAE